MKEREGTLINFNSSFFTVIPTSNRKYMNSIHKIKELIISIQEHKKVSQGANEKDFFSFLELYMKIDLYIEESYSKKEERLFSYDELEAVGVLYQQFRGYSYSQIQKLEETEKKLLNESFLTQQLSKSYFEQLFYCNICLLAEVENYINLQIAKTHGYDGPLNSDRIFDYIMQLPEKQRIQGCEDIIVSLLPKKRSSITKLYDEIIEYGSVLYFINQENPKKLKSWFSKLLFFDAMRRRVGYKSMNNQEFESTSNQNIVDLFFANSRSIMQHLTNTEIANHCIGLQQQLIMFLDSLNYHPSAVDTARYCLFELLGITIRGSDYFLLHYKNVEKKSLEGVHARYYLELKKRLKGVLLDDKAPVDDEFYQGYEPHMSLEQFYYRLEFTDFLDGTSISDILLEPEVMTLKLDRARYYMEKISDFRHFFRFQYNQKIVEFMEKEYFTVEYITHLSKIQTKLGNKSFYKHIYYFDLQKEFNLLHESYKQLEQIYHEWHMVVVNYYPLELQKEKLEEIDRYKNNFDFLKEMINMLKEQYKNTDPHIIIDNKQSDYFQKLFKKYTTDDDRMRDIVGAIHTRVMLGR